MSGTLPSDVDTSLEEGEAAGCCGRESFRGLLTTLRATPALGRLLGSADEWAAQSESPAVLSYEFWQARFHGESGALGAVLRLNGQPFVVVGVLPRHVNGTAVESGPAIWVPLIAGKYLGLGADPKRCCEWGIGGRLRPGVTLQQAEAGTVAALHAAMMAAESRNKPLTEDARKEIELSDDRLESIEHGVSAMRTRFGTGLLALFGGAALLLLLACVNIAGLLLARAAAREREMAVRAALERDARPPDAALARGKHPAVCGRRSGGIAADEGGATLATGALPAMRIWERG